MSRIYPRMVDILAAKRYAVYRRPYELNIVGVRSRRTKSNRFDDELHCFFRNANDSVWEYFVWPVTTDPGTYYLHSPISRDMGTAILAQGQYVNAYALGLHKGRQKALVQRGPVTVIRDYDRDARLDFNSGRQERGLFGINIHCMENPASNSREVDRRSAGCTDFAKLDDFKKFIGLCEVHERKYGNQFTYTLVDFRAERRETLRRLAIAGSATAVAGAAVLAFQSPQILKEKFA